jgi:hypothetical protein
MARRSGVRKTARMNLLTFKRSNMLPEPAEAGEPLVVSIFYHSVAAASRAIELVHRVTNNFEGDLPLETHLWNFDVLQLDEVGEQAALKTAFADLVVVAAPRADELPPQVKRCLEHAMTLRAGEEVAIVALVDNTHPQLHCSVCEYLKQLCSSAEGCFFSSKTLPLDSCPLTPERIHERAEAGSSVLDGIMRRRLPQF